MKITIASFIITIAATLLPIESINREINNYKESKNSLPSKSGFWYQGKVPYEISQQFGMSLYYFKGYKTIHK